MRVTVVDSGMGNLHSVVKALRKVGAQVLVTSDPQDVDSAEKLVLPGVGAFAENVKALVSRDLWNPVWAHAWRGFPFLGICVGMQLLLDESEEFGSHKGFGIIPGKVMALKAPKVPHVGWNSLLRLNSWDATPLQGLKEGADVYFVHSFVAVPADADDVLAFTTVEENRGIVAAVRRGNVWGTQFHPEKSGEVGLAILRKWVNE